MIKTVWTLKLYIKFSWSLKVVAYFFSPEVKSIVTFFFGTAAISPAFAKIWLLRAILALFIHVVSYCCYLWFWKPISMLGTVSCLCFHTVYHTGNSMETLELMNSSASYFIGILYWLNKRCYHTASHLCMVYLTWYSGRGNMEVECSQYFWNYATKCSSCYSWLPWITSME